MFDKSLFNKTGFDNLDPGNLDNLPVAFFGTGSIGQYLLEIHTPIGGDSPVSMYGDSIMIPLIEIEVYFDIDIAGEGNLYSPMILIMPMPINFSGVGNIEVFRFGETGISLIHLKDILLAPGETITIDTDSMIVLFGETHDVSSMTIGSNFFQLGVGRNNIGFSIVRDGAGLYPYELEVNAIWQNRWL